MIDYVNVDKVFAFFILIQVFYSYFILVFPHIARLVVMGIVLCELCSFSAV